MPMTLTRSLLAVLIPGIVAVSPWVLLVAMFTTAGKLHDSYPVLANALLFALTAIAGSLCEGIGTHFEDRWDKKKEKTLQIDDNWYEYLARPLSPEPVGYRYMSRLATTLYFELSMCVAMVFFGVGAAGLAWARAAHFGWAFALAVLAASFGLSYYFYWQATCTHVTLCKTRRELNIRLRSAG
jgi:hypothetical protein